MNLQKILYSFFFSLLLQSISAHILTPIDTIRLSQVEKKITPYPRQPIIIKTNPTAILWGPILCTAEYRIMVEVPSSKNQSMQIGISYLGKSPVWAIMENQKKTGVRQDFIVSGLRVQVANKFYLVKKKYGSPFGFYIAPQVSYSNAHIAIGKSRAYRKAYYDITQFTANVLAGFQVGRGKRFTADVFAGIGYKKNTWIYHINSFHSKPYDTKDFGAFYNSHIKLTLGINFGWTIF
jgi:hypothetical protein